MVDAIDRAVRAQGGAVVKPYQVKAMILAARRAYKVQSKAGLVDDEVGFDAWRKATLHDVVVPSAPDSFRAVTQRDYAKVMDYFQELAGDRRAQKPAAQRDGAQARALWTLNLVEGETAGAFGGREGARKYADALFWRIHGTERSIATPRQIWAVIFTLRNRAKAHRTGKRSKTAPGARGEAEVHLPPPGPSKRFPAFSRGL